MLAIPLVDWSLFSGMETALWTALLARALWAHQRAATAAPQSRRRDQLATGVWLALLVLTRPESLVIALLLPLATVYYARSLSTLGSLTRCLGPTVLAVGVFAATNRALTGEWSQAGAVRKLLTSNPYLSGEALSIEWLKNLAVLLHQALVRAVGGVLGLASLSSLAVAALYRQRTRAMALVLLASAVGILFVVCTNSTARFQNYRYAAAPLLCLLALAALGARATITHRRAAIRALGIGLVVALLAATSSEGMSQIDHFARASRNIAEQQVQIARQLKQLKPRRVLVNDAGAIPYISELPALDGLGLGGYRGMPFARASVHGLPAVIELIERLPDEERPDMMALYPAWWHGVADRFGTERASINIQDNVICGAARKVIYDADWSLLRNPNAARDPDLLDSLDVGDLVAERAHDYRFDPPGWVIGEVRRLRDDSRRYDAGRIISGSERFTVHVALPADELIVRGRSDDHATLTVERHAVDGSHTKQRVVHTHRSTDHFEEVVVYRGPLGPGDQLVVRPEQGSWRSFGYTVRTR